jgi:ATP-dependent Clp protease protease subunit
MLKKKMSQPLPYVIPLVDQVDGDMLTAVMAGLSEIAPGQALRVLICSPGGEAEPGIAIHDLLRDAGRERLVTTEVWGEAASVAPVILQAGKRRRMSENSRLMIHDPHGHTHGSIDVGVQELRIGVKGLVATRDLVATLLARRSGQTIEQIRKWMKRETVFTAGEALDRGFIDDIIGETNVQ